MSEVFRDLKYRNLWTAPFKCYWSLTPGQRKAWSNGCGPASAKFDLVPDDLLGVGFETPCEIHDLMYHFGIDEDDKRLADRLLLVNMLAASDDHCKTSGIMDRFTRVVLRRAAFAYYLAVSDWGKEAFYAKGPNT